MEARIRRRDPLWRVLQGPDCVSPEKHGGRLLPAWKNCCRLQGVKRPRWFRREGYYSEFALHAQRTAVPIMCNRIHGRERSRRQRRYSCLEQLRAPHRFRSASRFPNDLTAEDRRPKWCSIRTWNWST